MQVSDKIKDPAPGGISFSQICFHSLNRKILELANKNYQSGKLIRSKYIALVGEYLSFSERNINPHFS